MRVKCNVCCAGVASSYDSFLTKIMLVHGEETFVREYEAHFTPNSI